MALIELDEGSTQARIKVVGVGGGGGNAINTMIASGLDGVEFIAANTDLQALESNLAPTKVQLGGDLTRGLGAGADPDVGRDAALENTDDIRSALADADMVFVTAGMGGGTGTGGAPIIADIAKEMGALTVGVVTKPFQFEGRRRMRVADHGIEGLQAAVDTLITIPNQRLLSVAGQATTMLDAFRKVDEVLLNAVQGISDLVVIHGFINVDFADVRTVMAEKGQALMGTGYAAGDRKALEAAQEAISSPLLEDANINGATGILINITGGPDLTLAEINESATLIQDAAHEDANIIFGSVIDANLEDQVRITVIATGFESMPQRDQLAGQRGGAGRVHRAVAGHSHQPQRAARTARATEPTAGRASGAAQATVPVQATGPHQPTHVARRGGEVAPQHQSFGAETAQPHRRGLQSTPTQPLPLGADLAPVSTAMAVDPGPETPRSSSAPAGAPQSGGLFPPQPRVEPAVHAAPSAEPAAAEQQPAAFQAQPVMQHRPQPQMQAPTQTSPQAQAQAPTQPHPQVQPAAQPAMQPHPQAQAYPQAPAQPHPQAQVQPQAQPQPQPQVQPQPAPQVQPAPAAAPQAPRPQEPERARRDSSQLHQPAPQAQPPEQAPSSAESSGGQQTSFGYGEQRQAATPRGEVPARGRKRTRRVSGAHPVPRLHPSLSVGGDEQEMDIPTFLRRQPNVPE